MLQYLYTSAWLKWRGDRDSNSLCLFFLNYILNDINCNIEDIYCIDDIQLFLSLFADDTFVFAHAQDPTSLQSFLNNFEHYCNEWQFRLNAQKTKIKISGNRWHTKYNYFTLYNYALECVHSWCTTFLTRLRFDFFDKTGPWNRKQCSIMYSWWITKKVYLCRKRIILFDSLVAPN